jgi:hypothetical protein
MNTKNKDFERKKDRNTLSKIKINRSEFILISHFKCSTKKKITNL